MSTKMGKKYESPVIDSDRDDVPDGSWADPKLADEARRYYQSVAAEDRASDDDGVDLQVLFDHPEELPPLRWCRRSHAADHPAFLERHVYGPDFVLPCMCDGAVLTMDVFVVNDRLYETSAGWEVSDYGLECIRGGLKSLMKTAIEENKNGYVYRPDDKRSLYVKVAESAFCAYDVVHDDVGRETRRYKELPGSLTSLIVRQVRRGDKPFYEATLVDHMYGVWHGGADGVYRAIGKALAGMDIDEPGRFAQLFPWAKNKICRHAAGEKEKCEP